MTTIIGICLGIGAVIFSIIEVASQETGTVKTIAEIYLNFPSFLMVVGGTLASTLIAHPFNHLVRGFVGFFKIFFRRELRFVLRIEEICNFSKAHMEKGINGLEETLGLYKNENLLKDGISMAVNGYKLEEIKVFLNISISRHYDQEMIDYYVFKTMARTAPAFGMVGTLIGLIFMLNIMGSDPGKIGPFLAVALVTTFYGLIIAHLICNPMGNKLFHHAEYNLRLRQLEIEGIEYIMKKVHPIQIKDQMAGYLSPAQRKKILELNDE